MLTDKRPAVKGRKRANRLMVSNRVNPVLKGNKLAKGNLDKIVLQAASKRAKTPATAREPERRRAKILPVPVKPNQAPNHNPRMVRHPLTRMSPMATVKAVQGKRVARQLTHVRRFRCHAPPKARAIKRVPTGAGPTSDQVLASV
jgi:hypothetical protein